MRTSLKLFLLFAAAAAPIVLIGLLAGLLMFDRVPLFTLVHTDMVPRKRAAGCELAAA
jgi:hypothetical protein